MHVVFFISVSHTRYQIQILKKNPCCVPTRAPCPSTLLKYRYKTKRVDLTRLISTPDACKSALESWSTPMGQHKCKRRRDAIGQEAGRQNSSLIPLLNKPTLTSITKCMQMFVCVYKHCGLTGAKHKGHTVIIKYLIHPNC